MQQLVDSGKIFEYINLSAFDHKKDNKFPTPALKLIDRVRKQKGGNGVPAEQLD